MMERYARQIVLPEVGRAGQEKLHDAAVLIVGAGGLGCAVLQYVGAAGVNRLIVVDHDRVEESNLHRQPLYRMSDVGNLKVDAARAALLSTNPTLEITAVPERLTPANAARLIESANIVVDAADSFAATYTLSDACRRAGKCLISASVLGLSGYAGVFCGGAPSYRAVFPDLPHQAGSCVELGVLGTAVGVLGTLQAQLVLSVLLEIEPSVRGRVVTVDLRTLRFGGFDFMDAAEPDASGVQFIALSDLDAQDCIVDLRSVTEAPVPVLPSALRTDPQDLAQFNYGLARDRRVVLCCRSGVRAWRAARTLQRGGHENLALIALGP